MPGSTDETRLFVAPDGDDANPGTKKVPLATLEGARDAIQARRANGEIGAGGITVCVREGVYPRVEPLVLTQEDSGTADAPVVYRGYKDEEVRITGGRTVTGFEPVRDTAILERLPEAAHGHVLQADLRGQGITDFGELRPRGMGRPGWPAALELFYDDEPMTLARWPNEGWATIAETPLGKDGGGFGYEGDRPSRWVEAEAPWLHGYWTWDWADSYVGIEAIDTSKRLIRTRDPHGVYGYTAGKRYYALNLLEELDQPREWYLNRGTGILYFWPPKPIEDGTAVVSVGESLIQLDGTEHVAIQNLTLEACRSTAVVVKGGTDNIVGGCTIRNTGTGAVGVSGGERNGVAGCDIYNCDNGISLSGGDRATLTPCGNYAVNNHIHDYSRVCRTYRPAVGVHGVGMRVAHNLIHDAPHNAIQLSGNENLIEFNEIHSVCRETGDVGAYYMGRDWTMRGNVIRHNFFHHIEGPYTHGAMAVYLDDCASGTTIFGNVFYKASRAAFIGGGRDNLVENNIFIDCHPSVHVDARLRGWAKDYAAPDSGWGLQKKLEAMNYTEPPYSERYPALPPILDDDPTIPKGNVIVRNLSVDGKWIELHGVDPDWLTMRDNITNGDPSLFMNAEAMDFRLLPDSPIFSLGFKPIPFDDIGLTPGPYRKSVPDPTRAESSSDGIGSAL